MMVLNAHLYSKVGQDHLMSITFINLEDIILIIIIIIIIIDLIYGG